MTVPDFQQYKRDNRPISMVTCYDSWSAGILQESRVDCLLVGDSLAMTMHGHDTTIPATGELMSLHTAAVRRGAPEAFIIGDMPFLSYRKGLKTAMDTVELLMKAGANAVKLEGSEGHCGIIKHITRSGVPVMGHIGLTPQSVHQLGGFKVQGKEEEKAAQLLEEARILEEAGCFALVLECVPSPLAQAISRSLKIPVIGIGAGPGCDGQVLVLQDLLGCSKSFRPRFVRTFMEGFDLMKQALNDYDKAVKERSFPSTKESYK